MNIQQVAYRLATTGLIVEAEKKHIRPEWEEWIKLSAKRRTVLALYCFDCVFRTMNDIPMFPCDELRFMPAPAGKVLWQARSREQWESAYNHWLAKWDKGSFSMGEVMKRRRPESGASERLQMWLEEVDEFGMMMMIVVNGCR